MEARSLDHFKLTQSEDIYFRARASRAIDNMARSTSTFKAYYDLPTSKPFLYIIGLTAVIVTCSGFGGIYIWLDSKGSKDEFPLLAASATIIVGAIGWCVAAWIAHRNAIRQNTMNLLFARFSQATYTDSLHCFHNEFGHGPSPLVTVDWVGGLRDKDASSRRAAASVLYVLNYFEFMCSGVLNGDLDAKIIRDNVRGIICYYHDKCEPFIRDNNRKYPRAFENLIKVRTHYREP